MYNFFSLIIFNLFIGNAAGFKVLRQKLGGVQATKLVLRMLIQGIKHNPFADLNREGLERKQSLSWKEKNSQRQMAPALIMFDTLLASGYSQKQALDLVEAVIMEVASRYLVFSVPIIRQSDLNQLNLHEKEKAFSRIVARFDNVQGNLQSKGDKQFDLTVIKCHFSHYCRVLGYDMLAPLFCKADQAYFNSRQPCVDLVRTQTLAKNDEPCDFSFRIIAKE